MSMFNINNDVAIAANTGGQCDITNSNSSFGNFGLVSDGVGPLKYIGTITSSQSENKDEFIIDLSTPTVNISGFEYDITTGLSTVTTATPHGFQVGMGVTLAGIGLTCVYGTKIYPDGKVGYIFEVKSTPTSTVFTTNVGPSTVPSTYTSGGTAKLDMVRPFDGQNVFFDTLYQEVKKVELTSGGSGYTSPPTVTIQAPGTSWGIQATAVATIKNGSVDEITLVSSGRGYTSTPTITVTGSATATLEMVPKYYSILNQYTRLNIIHMNTNTHLGHSPHFYVITGKFRKNLKIR